MSSNKRPELRLEGNVSENFKNFELRFSDYCIQADYRNLEKDPNNPDEKADHYKKPKLELAALRSALPDEALQLVRYTIEPQISVADKNKPWVWMEKLRTHYTGSTGSSLMADRFKFWSIYQSPHETVQDWEVKIRQYGSLCQYTNMQDEMYRDKFVFGLHSETIRTELLKTHTKADGTAKSMTDVVSEAKTYESAVRANKLIEQGTKLEEQVNWSNSYRQPPQHRQQRPSRPQSTAQSARRQHEQWPHRLMKLTREPGTCYWCGDRRGSHAWSLCPANGKTCKRCGGNDHLARVCMEDITSR